MTVAREISKIGAMLLEYLFIGPFLAWTAVFPIIILLEEIGFHKAFNLNLGFVFEFLFRTPLEEASSDQLIFFFYLFLIALGIIVGALSLLIRKKVDIKMWHVIALMTGIYLFTLINVTLRGSFSEVEAWFMLTFYLFNIFSVFGYFVIREVERGGEVRVW